MNYQEAIDYLYNATPMFQQIGSKAYKEGLENTIAIDSRCNHPHKIYRTIHIAGTNGKGSVSHVLSSILQHAGYRVGLYTSPHLTNFRERIRVNGEMITEDFITEYIRENIDFFNEIQPSFFEATTGLAFLYFASEKVDIAVIETGLGGRLDCTNIIRPDLSIITNISFDHVALLGNTLPLIAKEKAGIIKPRTPVVIGEYTDETKPVFLEKAQEMEAPITFTEEAPLILSSRLLPSGKWLFETKEYPQLLYELGGLVQKKNAATILCSIRKLTELGYKIPSEAVYKGFASVVQTTGLRGRWQVAGQKPKIVLDTGHNAAGIGYIVQQLQQETYDRLHFVLGMVNDKDISTILNMLPKDAVYYFTKASVPRALNESELMEKAISAGLSGKSYPTVKDAIVAAKKAATASDFIFIGGSTFIVADALD